MDIDEPVHLCPYDPEWPAQAEAERVRLSRALRLDHELLEHIGSTAVAELEAKPIIDLMIGCPVFPPAQSDVERLLSLGYENCGEAGVAGRLYLRRRGPVAFNLHAVQLAGEHWKSNLALRDYLRTHPAQRRMYVEAKRAALRSHPNMLLDYSQAKAPFLSELVARARRWRAVQKAPA